MYGSYARTVSTNQRQLKSVMWASDAAVQVLAKKTRPFLTRVTAFEGELD
jgi:hypothetical protein